MINSFFGFQLKRNHYEQIMKNLVGNPLHVYSLIYRILKTLPEVITSLKQCSMRAEAERVENILRKVKVTEEDLVGADVDAIMANA